MSIAVPFNVRLLATDDVELMESLLTTLSARRSTKWRPMGISTMQGLSQALAWQRSLYRAGGFEAWLRGGLPRGIRASEV